MLVASSSATLYYGLLALCLLLGIGLMIIAWRRPNPRQRWARMVAGAVAAAALWLTAFPPLRPVSAARAEAIILTDGYQPDTLRQLLRKLGAGTPVWYYGPDSATLPARSRFLPSLLRLAEQRPALRQAYVLGQGLPAAELPLLGKIVITQHAQPAFDGFRTAYWNQQLILGEALRVEGAVAGPKNSAPVWVCLRAAGAIRDSVRISATGNGAFQLRYQPKTPGLAVYELLLRRTGNVVATEPVPVEITPPQLPAVLLLSATPSFEFKFLKNYLAEAHYPVALRTTVSRGLVETDFVNQPAQPLNRLTPMLLSHFAVLVADAPTLAALTATEAQALQAAISAGRLGLLVLAGAAPLPRAVPARADFTILPRPAAQAAPQPLAWPDAPAGARASLPAQLRPAPALRPLVTGPGAALLAASRRVGSGQVVVSVVPEAFRWALQGQTPLYASFWNRLLTAARPPAAAAASWHTSPRWPRPQQLLTLHLAASALPEIAPTVSALAGGPAVRLALAQDTRLPEWSTAPFWPSAAGWQQVRGPGTATHNFYVFPAAAWAGPELSERAQAAQQQAPLASAPGTLAADTVTQPWPATWFFGLFLLAASYLWLEEKL